MLESITRSERVIIVEDDRIRSVVIGPRQRLRPAFFAALACIGMGMAALGWAVTAARLVEARRMASFLEHGADSLATQLDDSRRQLTELAQMLDTAQAALVAAREGKDPRSQMAAAEQSLESVEQMARSAAARRAQSALAAAAQAASVDLTPSADATVRADGLAQALAEAQAEAVRLRSTVESAQTEREEMASRLADTEYRMSAMADGQLALLSRLTEHTDLRISAIESALKDTGINLDRVLKELDRTGFGMGGPLVPLPPEAVPPQTEQAMAQLEAKLGRQARLRALHERLPLSAPVDDFYVSSGFGGRRDPMTNQWARHEGLDLVARMGMPVMATAPGKVVEVGWDEGYGRSVIVDHGFGIRTRYAHLDKATVKEGDALAYGQVLGTLGNSGRSSGPHVHYEVLIDGKPVDPLRFMEKGRHVCEG